MTPVEKRFSNLSKVPDIPEWGRPRFNRMGHRIKLKGVANGPGCQPIPGEDKTECRFCDAKFSDGRQAINHYMGKKHQVIKSTRSRVGSSADLKSRIDGS